jgi:hypothetical protein
MTGAFHSPIERSRHPVGPWIAGEVRQWRLWVAAVPITLFQDGLAVVNRTGLGQARQ